MLAAGEDAGGLQSSIEGSGHLNDLVGSGAVAATTQRVVRLVVKGDIEHGAEIEVESKDAEQMTC